MAIMPMVGRARVLRSWGGIMDMTLDGSPIIDRTPVPGLYLNGGWCYGGFKATPASGWCFAHLLARDEPHPIAASYRLDRFASGQLIDEKGAGAQGSEEPTSELQSLMRISSAVFCLKTKKKKNIRSCQPDHTK